MTEMIERLARLLHVEDIRAPIEQPWKALREFDQDEYRNTARKIIEAMREPTEAMVEAIYRRVGCVDCCPADVKIGYQEGIDAALTPGVSVEAETLRVVPWFQRADIYPAAMSGD